MRVFVSQSVADRGIYERSRRVLAAPALGASQYRQKLRGFMITRTVIWPYGDVQCTSYTMCRRCWLPFLTCSLEDCVALRSPSDMHVFTPSLVRRTCPQAVVSRSIRLTQRTPASVVTRRMYVRMYPCSSVIVYFRRWLATAVKAQPCRLHRPTLLRSCKM